MAKKCPTITLRRLQVVWWGWVNWRTWAYWRYMSKIVARPDLHLFTALTAGPIEFRWWTDAWWRLR